MVLSKLKTPWLICYFLFVTAPLSAQHIDLEAFGQGKAFKLRGGISANGIFFDSDQNIGREPFTYFLQGNLNVTFYQFSMPIGYSYSNQGNQLNYNLPFDLNRLSLHPKYKWIQAHIGDVAITFSPYTLNGHQFTGGGLELTPKGPFKISVMSGRLLKATEDDGKEQTIPAFLRMGYGIKMKYEKERYSLGIIGFYAKDRINSITNIPDDKGVAPKENMVLGFEGSYKVQENLKINAVYALSGVTQDSRADPLDANNGKPVGLFLKNRASTEYYEAGKLGIDYSFGKSTLGVAYERIDPGYETLGAYFFNNDFENITLNCNTILLNNKLSLALNVGYQQDDLKNQKQQATNRTVGAINATYSASEVLTITTSYSNFSTYTNSKVNQFEVINDDNLLDDNNFDYRQLSQNANVNINYVFSKGENLHQNININYALADVSNAEDGIVRIGNASTFHNGNASYTIGLPQNGMRVTTALNGTLNIIGAEDSTTWGPTVGVGNKFLDNNLSTNLGVSYNTSNSNTVRTNVANLRAKISYLYKKKHNFNLSAIQQFKNLPLENSRELTITFGHSYSF
ncbi:hypothetical protein [Flagellimonas onchidii]|uniref:hypothetical protein n=1 Tax=Flagellimonas onchidii TaxID=2562684 RepID=UPI0010A60EE7|nr:hypothetical protein [Allomuricauda onchidii]